MKTTTQRTQDRSAGLLFTATTLCWTLCCALGTGCNESKPAPAPIPDVPPAASLPSVDLCGANQNSRALLEGLVKEKGIDGVRSYFSEHAKVPSNVNLCQPPGGKADTFSRAVRILVQRVDSRGHGIEPVVTIGSLPANQRGIKSASVNAFPGGPDQGGVGVVVDFYGP